METHPPYWEQFPNFTFFLRLPLLFQNILTILLKTRFVTCKCQENNKLNSGISTSLSILSTPFSNLNWEGKTNYTSSWLIAIWLLLLHRWNILDFLSAHINWAHQNPVHTPTTLLVLVTFYIPFSFPPATTVVLRTVKCFFFNL